MSESSQAWTKLPAITGSHSGCMNCGAHPDVFPPDGLIAVGFGSVIVTKDAKIVYSEPLNPRPENDYWTGSDAEDAAHADPDHDWRIKLNGALSGRTYQRHGVGQWVLVEKNEGFA